MKWSKTWKGFSGGYIFNKKFRIYINNQREERYILTPKMMENLLYLEERIKGVKITMVDNKMYIGFERKNLFELGTIKQDKLETIFDSFYDEIEVILNIINEIQTNNKIFKI